MSAPLSNKDCIIAIFDSFAKTVMKNECRDAVVYALGYLYEHREEADHHALTLTLRSVLFAVREGVNF